MKLSDNNYDAVFNQKSCKAMSKKQDFVLFSGVRKKLINLNCLIKKNR